MLNFRRKYETTERAAYGHRRVRDVPHPKRPGVRCVSFENYTLDELIGHLRGRRQSGAYVELLERYDPPRVFPDLGDFRLGPNTFRRTALDWIMMLSQDAGRDSELVAHGITTRFRWDGDSANLPRGWTGVVRRSYEESVLGSVAPNTLVGLFIFAEKAFREHGWAAEVAQEMKRLAREEGLTGLIIPLRLPTRYEWENARIPFEEFAFLRRDDGQYRDHWLRMHVRLGAEVIGVCNVSHQHAMHPDDLRRLFHCEQLEKSGEHLVRREDEYYTALVDLEHEFAVINEGCVWVRHPL